MQDRPASAGSGDDAPEPARPTPGRLSRLVDRAAGVSAERRFVVIFAGALALMSAVYLAFVLTETGQRLENLALRGAAFRTDAERAAGLDRLSQVSIVIFGSTVVAIVLVGLLRRRPRLGFAVGGLMSASVVAVELLKDVLPRPLLVDGPSWILRNSFPSGSAAVAAAMAIGAILVSPDRLRWVIVPVGAAYAAIVGEALQTTGWHRLSDTIGGVLIVIAVASAGLAVLARAGFVQRSEHGRIDRRVRTILLLAALAALAVGTVVLALAAAFPLLTAPDGGIRAFLQTALPLLGVGFVTAAIVGFSRVVEPYTLGRGLPDNAAPAEAA
jgi:membrane-associated phospholipid phosphatase